MRKALTTSAVARLLGVAVGSISNWIDQGRLKAGRTPGGHRRIEVDDLIAFLRKQGLRVPPELAPAAAKVLVVDDDQPLTKWLAEEIKEEYPDCEVLVAHDGFAAGEMVGAHKPQAVILDLRMPGMDGYEVCRRIKSNEDTKDTAVIAITAYPSAEAEKSILDCGARAYLTKPLDLELLLKELADALAERG